MNVKLQGAGILALLLLYPGCGEEAGTPRTRDAYVYTLLDAGNVPRARADRGFLVDAAPQQGDVGMAPLDAERPHDSDVSLRLDATPAVNDSGIQPDRGMGGGDEDPLRELGVDTDGDGLDDAWERGAQDATLLDWNNADTDGDGIPDGQEDFDGDGLSCLQEQAAGRMPSMTDTHRPHPFRLDLLIELDAMSGRTPSPDVLQMVLDAYGDVPNEGVPPHTGIKVHFFADQLELAEIIFDSDFGPRQGLLEAAGPRFEGSDASFPVGEMLHVILAARRSDLDTRGGEVITHAQDIDKTGVLIYVDTINRLFPRCGLSDPPPVPDVSAEEALAGTLIHEIGHALQLGHDTAVGNGINYWNIMAVPTGCVDTRRRAHGEGNDQPTLGSTAAVRAARFSHEAARLIDLSNKLSVDTAELVDDNDGREM